MGQPTPEMIEFVKIVQGDDGFEMEAGPDLPVENRVAANYDELLGRLVTSFINLPDNVTVDVEQPDHTHVTLTHAHADRDAPVLAA